MNHRSETENAPEKASAVDQRYREFVEKEIAIAVCRKRRTVVMGVVLMLLFYGLVVSILSSVVEVSRNPDSLVNRIVAGMEDKMPGLVEAGRKEARAGVTSSARSVVRRLGQLPQIVQSDVEAEELERARRVAQRLQADLSEVLIEKIEAEPEVFADALEAFNKTGESKAMGEFLSTRVTPEAVAWYGEPDYGIVDTIIAIQGVVAATSKTGADRGSPEQNAEKRILELMSQLLANGRKKN